MDLFWSWPRGLGLAVMLARRPHGQDDFGRRRASRFYDNKSWAGLDIEGGGVSKMDNSPYTFGRFEITAIAVSIDYFLISNLCPTRF